MNLFKKLFQVPVVAKWLRYRSYKKSVKQADHLRSMYHKKYLVFLWHGKFQAVSKLTLKNMHQSGVFKKSGKNLRQIEKLALYVTR